MKEIINIIKSYIEVATEDEYDKIAQTIRHDLVFSEFDKDIEKYVQYISNSSDVCHACEESYSAQASLINLNTGDAYSLDLFEHEIERRDGIVSIHKMKRLFCDNCIAEILEVIKNQVIEELVYGTYSSNKIERLIWRIK